MPKTQVGGVAVEQLRSIIQRVEKLEEEKTAIAADIKEVYAEAKAKLGTSRTFIVSGDEGLDELSLAGGNELADVSDGEFEMRRVDASKVGLANAPVEAIRGGDASHNAKALKALLEGTPGPYRDAVLLNAAATLVVAGKSEDWAECADMAAQALDSGAAKRLLERWIAMAV